MLVTKFDPFMQDFDRAVQRAFGRANGTFDRAVLPMDVIRREHDVELRIDMPGIDPDSVEVTTEQNMLAVSAKRTEEYGEQEKPLIRERVMGSFSRKIRLAETVDTGKIEASFDKGVLSIVLPLQEKAKPRRVEIKQSAAAEITA